MLLSGLFATLVAGALVQSATPAPAPAPLSAEANAAVGQRFSGTWEYNPELSVDAATGRSESSAAASQRRGVIGGPAPAVVRGTAGLGPSSSSVIQDGVYSLYVARRDTRRDLLEIAPQFRIQVAQDALVVTDDLDRVLTFPANGEKQSYQLGAALFDARSSWDGDRFRIDIEGPDGLKIDETWFLSEDGSRLFLVIRVGDPDKDTRVVGVNRVYDRVQ